MPLRKFLNKLMDMRSAKEVDATKAAILREVIALTKNQKDHRDFNSAISQLIDFYVAKRAEFIIDFLCSFPEPAIAELFKQIGERLVYCHKEHIMQTQTGSVFPTTTFCLLEFLLKIVSREHWWNSLVLGSCSPAFHEMIKDRTLPCECYVAIVYVLSIVVPFSLPYLDERLMQFLCSVCTLLLNRVFGDSGVRTSVTDLADDALKSSIMQLVLILYGVFPITFLKHIISTCPSEVVDYVVSQLRLHPVLSQHLAQSRQPISELGSTGSHAVIGGAGLSQAECRSKNRFRGKEPSDIVTECLNYTAQSPPKMFSQDFPQISLLAQADESGLDTARSEATEGEGSGEPDGKVIPIQKQLAARCHHVCQPDWCHRGDEDEADMSQYYSLPTMPGLLMAIQSANGHLQPLNNAGEPGALPDPQNSPSSPVSDGSQLANSPLKEPQVKLQKSLAQLNASIRTMLNDKRRQAAARPESPADAPQSPGSESVPTGYIRSYLRLTQLRSEGAPEVEMLREQLRLAQLSLQFERHRQLIFISKNRSLMTQLAELQRLNRDLEAQEHRIRELETSLESEVERRQAAEGRASRQSATGGLTVNVGPHALQPSDLLLADLSPRYRPAKAPAGPSGGTAALAAAGQLGSAPMLANEQAGDGTGMHRAQSSGEFSGDSVVTGSLVRRETIDELKRQRDRLQGEVDGLRQQLRHLQLEGSDAAAGGDEAAEKIDVLSQQLSDSRREVSALGQLMSEMKERLDVAENERRHLAAELNRIRMHGQERQISLSPTEPLPPPGQQAGLASNVNILSSTVNSASNQRLEQYPSLKRQVEKILLTKQEIAVSKD